MIKLYYRGKNEKGEWSWLPTTKSWKTVDACFKETGKWLLETKTSFYVSEETDVQTIKCPF